MFAGRKRGRRPLVPGTDSLCGVWKHSGLRWSRWLLNIVQVLNTTELVHFKMVNFR